VVTESDPQGWIGGLVVAVIAIGTGVATWLKSRSSARVETANDGAKVELVDRLQARADGAERRADELFNELQKLGDQRTEDARAIERLTSDLAHTKTENLSMRRNLRRMAQGLTPERREAWEQALETDFAPLGPSEGR